MQLSVIIVNYNVKFFLEQCLCSVQKACKEIDSEIFVVDNHSDDGSREYLEPKFPGVIFKWNPENTGFAKANNSVLKEAKGNYILFLNPDTIIAEDSLSLCLQFFEQHLDCGALGVRMINGSGKFLKESKRSFPSPLASFFKMTGMANLFPSSKLFARYYAGHLPENKTTIVDALPGAFMMLSKKAIEKTLGFDERFFMYGEDLDLSYRIQEAGLNNYFFAGTTIIHFKGESTQKLSLHYISHFYGAMKLFVIKHYSGKRAVCFFLLQAIGASKKAAALKLLLQKKRAKNPSLMKPLPTAVVSTQPEYNKLIQLLKYASPSVIICGRIAIDTNDKEAAIGLLKDPVAAVQKRDITQVVFCEGALSFKNIIHELPRFPKKTGFLFHAGGSNSIVGSSKKNRGPLFIFKPGA